MGTETKTLSTFIETELNSISNEQVLKHVRGLLVQPRPIFLNWAYGDVDQQYLCWIVLEETEGYCGIAYCSEGFGPNNPWGLVGLKGNSSMGMDCEWYPTFMQAYIESAASEIPIWHIAKEDADGRRLPISGEGGWDEIWAQVMALRETDPESHYHVETKILDERE